MTQYLIYVGHDHKGDAPENWMEEVKEHRGVSESSSDLIGMVINCGLDIAQKLREKFYYLNIEYIMTEEDLLKGVDLTDGK